MGWWDWAGIIMGAIGVLAFALAIQPFMQFCFGHPKLKVEFDTHETKGGRILFCGLHSPEVSGILRKIGIRRDAIQGLSVSASIVDSRTKKTMEHVDFAALIDAEAKVWNVLDVVGSKSMVMVWVALMRKGDERVLTALRADEGGIELPPSEYICDLSIKSASVNRELSQKFMVGSLKHELYWEESSS